MKLNWIDRSIFSSMWRFKCSQNTELPEKRLRIRGQSYGDYISHPHTVQPFSRLSAVRCLVSSFHAVDVWLLWGVKVWAVLLTVSSRWIGQRFRRVCCQCQGGLRLTVSVCVRQYFRKITDDSEMCLRKTSNVSCFRLLLEVLTLLCGPMVVRSFYSKIDAAGIDKILCAQECETGVLLQWVKVQFNQIWSWAENTSVQTWVLHERAHWVRQTEEGKSARKGTECVFADADFWVKSTVTCFIWTSFQYKSRFLVFFFR